MVRVEKDSLSDTACMARDRHSLYGDNLVQLTQERRGHYKMPTPFFADGMFTVAAGIAAVVR